MCFLIVAGLVLVLAGFGCDSGMDKPGMNEPISANTVLDAERRLTGDRETLLAPGQPSTDRPAVRPPAAREATPPVEDPQRPEEAFPDRLADQPTNARGARGA